MTKDVIELAREACGAGTEDPLQDGGMLTLSIREMKRFAALVAARERDRVAQEFDRRAALSAGGPAFGWYEPNEPAEIVRALNTKGEGNDRP